MASTLEGHTMPKPTSARPPLQIPDPDDIRAAIDDVDERARLLRRFLRLAVRLRVHLTTADKLPTPSTSVGKEGGRV